MARANHETATHIAIGGYLASILPPVAARTLFHCPNGENRSAKTGALLKRMGVRKGVADWLFVFEGILHCIEIKVEQDIARGIARTYKTADQREFQEDIQAAGGRYSVCRTFADVDAFLALHGVPVRGRAA